MKTMSNTPEEMPDNATDRPLATFALLAYNQEKYIREAVEGALSQTYEPLEIILSDDCSSDRTFELMQEMAAAYVGPHKVILNRNPNNFGIGSHINKVMDLSIGKYIVGAAGDDISKPERVSNTVNAFLMSPEKILSVWSSARYIDAAGKLIERPFPKPTAPYSERSMAQNVCPVIGATHAWDRTVFDFFGPLDQGVMFEDNAISFRSYLIGDIKFLAEDLVDYRFHDNNITNYTKKTDSIELCRAAAKRTYWAMNGTDQRMRDLETVKINYPNFHKDYCSLYTEIGKFRLKIERQYHAYKKFPKISRQDLLLCMKDIALTKILLRAIKCRFESSLPSSIPKGKS